jgi:hypothetical protein
MMLLLTLPYDEPQVTRRLINELKKLVPAQMWPLSYEMLLECAEKQSAGEHLLQEIRERAASSIVRPGDIGALRRLHRALRAGECGTLDTRYTLSLAEILANNPRVHTPHTQITALNDLGLYAAELGDFEKAEHALRRSLEMSGHLSAPWRNMTMQTVANAASYTRNLEDATHFLNRVRAGLEQTYPQIRVELRLPRAAADP